MTIFTPTQLKSLCTKYGLSPSKAYGQNYLVQAWPIERMIEAADVVQTDTVIEIGPGFGILTEALSKRVKKVVAFEIERTLESFWMDRQQELQNVLVVWGNALKQIPAFVSSYLRKDTQGRMYKVVANIPYQITSNLLRVLLEAQYKPERIVLMVQKEVAERVCAKPGEMSLLSVSVQYYGTPKIVETVGKGNFWPSPKVDSAILSITNIHDEEGADLFFRITKAAFASRRKQLFRQVAAELNVDPETVKQQLYEVVGNEKARAEELSIVEWRAFVKNLQDKIKMR